MSETLTEHRICNADYGRVACYCSAWKWMTLDEYGEHVERILAARLADVSARLAAVEALADEWREESRARRGGPPLIPLTTAWTRLDAALRADPSEGET